MKMNKEFIRLYDDEGHIYIVNINNISIIDVDGLGILFGEIPLKINQNSMQRILNRIAGDYE